MRKAAIFAILGFVLFAPFALCAQSLQAADAILAKAEASAAQQHKLVFLVFHASWCGPCRAFDRYLESSDIRPIIERYFVVARINAMEESGNHPERNNPGANQLLQKLGGEDGVPFFAFLGANGKPIIDSIAPKTGNVGFPVEPEEVDWFMKMLAKAVPSMTPAETKALELKLRKKG